MGVVVARTIEKGVARGIFSNEAGLGSAPIAHAAAKTQEMIREGFVAMLGPFIDTIVVLHHDGAGHHHLRRLAGRERLRRTPLRARRAKAPP